MDPLFIYFLKVNFALAVLYIIYRILFQNDTFFQLRRFALLSIYLIAFLYPLPDISSWLANQPNLSEVVIYYSSVVKPEIVVGTNEMDIPISSWSWRPAIYLLLFMYGIGLFFLLYRSLAELISVFRIYLRCRKKIINGIRVCILPVAEEPYSFFKWIFVHPDACDRQALNEVLIHESTHVSQKHSIDVITGEIIKILCWVNPFAWLLKKEININHEYIADRQVMLAGYDKKEYQYHMIGMKHSPMAAAELYNYFSVLPLKKRITMLNKKRTNRVRKVKYLALIPMAIGLLVINNIDAMARIVTEQLPAVITTSMHTENSATKEAVDLPIFQDDDKVYKEVDIMPQFPGGDSELLKFLSKSIQYPAVAFDNKVEGRVVASYIVEKDGSCTNYEIVKSLEPSLDKEALRILKTMPKWTPGKNDGKTVRVKYTVPVTFRIQKELDRLSAAIPQFPGGEPALIQYVARSVSYPQVAQDKGIQGVVTIQFMVETDGSLSNVSIKKGVDSSLDQEAVRVIKSMPKWIPAKKEGKAVRMESELPITFRLQ